MEEIHRNHKEATWGWFGLLLGFLDGFPRHAARPARSRRRSTGVVTPWNPHSPRGWSA